MSAEIEICGPENEGEAERSLRSLACWLGVGGYNAPTVDATAYETKIREEITLQSTAARELAELVLSMGMATEKGLRARNLARRVLGVASAA